MSTDEPATQTAEWRRAMEVAASIADTYATENFRLAGDTILTDPVLSGRDFSAQACAISDRLQVDGCIHSAMAHAAQNIAKAIRSAIDG